MNVADQCNAAALDGLLVLLNGGAFRLAEGSADLASLPLQASGNAFQAATVASPAVATSNPVGTDSTPIPGVIDNFRLDNASGVSRIAGTVGTSGADLILTDNVIPADATEVSCPGGIAISLDMN